MKDRVERIAELRLRCEEAQSGDFVTVETDSINAVLKALDEARAEVERLRNALACISLDEYESTSSASEKVHGHARIARKALEKP